MERQKPRQALVVVPLSGQLTQGRKLRGLEAEHPFGSVVGLGRQNCRKIHLI